MYRTLTRKNVNRDFNFVVACFVVVLCGYVCIHPNLASGSASDSSARAKEYTLDELIAALIIKESGGDVEAVGDTHLKNKAYGPLQIRQPCVDDVNRILKTSYRAEDCKGNLELSVLICTTYLDKWATEERVGRKVTVEDMARIWNGGPNGYKKAATLQYWKDVERILERHRRT